MKQTAAQIELQLSERRFILEAITAGARLLEVPIVTAGVWYYLSRTNANLGALNKAILAAELAPIIGDIKFPEGVILGAAMESTEDVLNILEKEGVIPSSEEIKAAAVSTTEDAGSFLADVVLNAYTDGTIQNSTCSALEDAMYEARVTWTEHGRDSLTGGGAIVRHGIYLKQAKRNGCDRPGFVSEAAWLKA